MCLLLLVFSRLVYILFYFSIIGDGYAKLVFAIEPASQLFTYSAYTKLCRLQTQLESSPHYSPACDSGCMCNSFSYVNYVAYLLQTEGCENVTQTDFNQVVSVLKSCRTFYTASNGDCWLDQQKSAFSNCNMTEQCRDQAISDLFRYIIDQSNSTKQYLTISFIHMAQGKASHDYYLELLDYMEKDTEDDVVKLFALDFGLKDYVFEEYLLTDTAWIGLALGIVLFVMWLYTGSLFLTSMSLLSMAFTVVISFTIYHLVFRINYFPFLNLLATIVVVGTGADDLFIYWKTWTAIKHSRNAGIMERLVAYTFKHASVAMFVTSASTATAFYASSYTDIVSVRCFCIFAGTCVLVHYALVITWLPVCVVVYEKYALGICYTSEKSGRLCKFTSWLHSQIVNAIDLALKKLTFVSVFWYIWIPLFLILSVGGGVSIFVWPKLSSPSADMFQMLPAHHPFEVYDQQVRERFAFTSHSDRASHLPLIFVFGIDTQFTGEYFNLKSDGHLTFKKLPDLSNPKVQLWFSEFCYELRQQPYFDKFVSQPYGCFIERFRFWLRYRYCSDDPVCCQDQVFPYSPSVIDQCLPKWSNATSSATLYKTEPGLRYNGDRLSAIIISFWSSIQFSYNYTMMNDFYQNVRNFTDSMVAKCPAAECSEFSPSVTTSGGWSFYDVQNTLITSLPFSLIIVLVSSAFIIFLTTLNFLLTICSMISISCSILLTLGVLALMGWELNILESVIVTLTVGLSMDYTLHVAVAYRIASSTVDRKNRVAVSLHHVGGSIFAAMITSVIAGLCILPAHVVAYRRLGVFLVLVTSFSWLSAFFLMSSLLVLIGPVGNFSQISCSCKRKRPATRQLDKTIYSEELSSDAITNAAQTLSSHVNMETSRDDEENNLELATQSTCLLEHNCVHTHNSPHHRLSIIEEGPVSEEES